MNAVPSPAGFWKRYVAYFIDFLLVSTVLNVLMTPLLFVGGLGNDAFRELVALGGGGDFIAVEEALWRLVPYLAWMTGMSTVGYVVLAGAYFIAMEASPRQATLGKQLMAIKVTALDGGPPGTARVVGRFLAAALSWLTLNLGHALAAWTRDKRALHDFLAGTRVENADPAHPQMPTWGWVIVALNVVGMLALAVICVAAVLLVWFALPR